MIRVWIIIVLSTFVYGCMPNEPVVTRIKARPTLPTVSIEHGEHSLGLGGLRLVNGRPIWRDGTLYVPQISKSSNKPLPLLIWLHGGGGQSNSYRYLFPLAEDYGVVILTLDARHNTWDGIDSPFGPDVMFIDAALQYIFERVAIDPRRIGLGGLSDGASYALALGRVNGDLFSHLIAVAPGHLKPPAPPTGKPRIFVAHGTRDNVYNVAGSRNYIVPRLKRDGYNVNYLEFDGPHWLPVPVAHQLLKWLAHSK